MYLYRVMFKQRTEYLEWGEETYVVYIVAETFNDAENITISAYSDDIHVRCVERLAGFTDAKYSPFPCSVPLVAVELG